MFYVLPDVLFNQIYILWIVNFNNLFAINKLIFYFHIRIYDFVIIEIY